MSGVKVQKRWRSVRRVDTSNWCTLKSDKEFNETGNFDGTTREIDGVVCNWGTEWTI